MNRHIFSPNRIHQNHITKRWIRHIFVEAFKETVNTKSFEIHRLQEVTPPHWIHKILFNRYFVWSRFDCSCRLQDILGFQEHFPLQPYKYAQPYCSRFVVLPEAIQCLGKCILFPTRQAPFPNDREFPYQDCIFILLVMAL